jgi:aspartate/methionine/tyrosine aminotransferase
LEREGKDIIHMEVGEPDFDTPEHIKQVAWKAMREGKTKYTPSVGILELREAITEHLNLRRIRITPEEILITPGAKHAIFCAMAATLDPGDEVIILSPCWTYESIVRLVGAKTVYVGTSQAEGFGPNVEGVKEKVTSKTRMLLINYPNNPTGAVANKEDLQALGEIAKDNGLWILSDEIYDHLVYEGEHISIASLSGICDRIIYVNGFSKTYAMTGWRLGYAAAPLELVKEMVKIQQASTTCAASFVQEAGIAALRGPQDFVKKVCEEYRKRRDVLVGGLNSIGGFECTKPAGAFYVFPNIEKLGLDSAELCERLLREAGVATVPGSEFGPYGEGHIRLSYSIPMRKIEEALERIKSVVEKLG